MNAADRKRLVPFAYGFRPFFLLAGLYAVIAVAAWLWLFTSGSTFPAGLTPQYWHGHEMVFGFIAAAYLLLALSVLLRVFDPALFPFAYRSTIVYAGVFWLLSFGVYIAVHTPILLGPRVDGKPG